MAEGRWSISGIMLRRKNRIPAEQKESCCCVYNKSHKAYARTILHNKLRANLLARQFL